MSLLSFLKCYKWIVKKKRGKKKKKKKHINFVFIYYPSFNKSLKLILVRDKGNKGNFSNFWKHAHVLIPNRHYTTVSSETKPFTPRQFPIPNYSASNPFQQNVTIIIAVLWKTDGNWCFSFAKLPTNIGCKPFCRKI